MKSLLEKINKDLRPTLQKELGVKNIHSLPSVAKTVINVGIRSDVGDKKVIENIIQDLKAIAGQSPVKTLAKKSVSAFKVREGQVVGLMVTLRGRRMYDFLDKLMNVTLARVRDFRGLEEKGFDSSGNYSIGLKDQTAFPEISSDQMKTPFGLQVTIVMRAENKDQAKKFLKLIGLPLKK